MCLLILTLKIETDNCYLLGLFDRLRWYGHPLPVTHVSNRPVDFGWMFCVGVLWSGDHLFEGVVETLELLRSKGWSRRH